MVKKLFVMAILAVTPVLYANAQDLFEDNTEAPDTITITEDGYKSMLEVNDIIVEHGAYRIIEDYNQDGTAIRAYKDGGFYLAPTIGGRYTHIFQSGTHFASVGLGLTLGIQTQIADLSASVSGYLVKYGEYSDKPNTWYLTPNVTVSCFFEVFCDDYKDEENRLFVGLEGSFEAQRTSFQGGGCTGWRPSGGIGFRYQHAPIYTRVHYNFDLMLRYKDEIGIGTHAHGLEVEFKFSVPIFPGKRDIYRADRDSK